MDDRKDYRTGLVESLKATVPEIMATMAFADITLRGTSEKREFAVSGPVVGFMPLVGERKGMVALSMPESLARGVIASITGADPGTLNRQDLLDGIGELINMLTGSMKTRVADTDLQLSPPIAALGNEMTMEWRTSQPTTVMEFEMSGECLSVHVCAL